MRLISRLLPVVALLFIGRGAKAQEDSPIGRTFFVGADVPVGTSANSVLTGYIAGLDLDYRIPFTPTGIRGELSYSRFNANGLPKQASAQHNSEIAGSLNGVLYAGLPRLLVNPYFTFGGTFESYTSYVESGNVTYQNGQNHLGFNVGAGVDIPLATLGLRFDVRYRQISGDNASFRTVPITVGIKF